MSREQYVELFPTLSEAIEFENSVLGADDGSLPHVALLVREGEQLTPEETAEYYRFLVSQVDVVASEVRGSTTLYYPERVGAQVPVDLGDWLVFEGGEDGPERGCVVDIVGDNIAISWDQGTRTWLNIDALAGDDVQVYDSGPRGEWWSNEALEAAYAKWRAKVQA